MCLRRNESDAEGRFKLFRVLPRFWRKKGVCSKPSKSREVGGVLEKGFSRRAPTSPFAAKTAAQAVADFVRDSRTSKIRCAKTLAASASSGGGDPAPLKHQIATS